LARKRVELRAGRPVGKDRARDRDVALEHAGEALAHLGGRLADRDRARDVGGAVLYWPPESIRNNSPARIRDWSCVVTR
jgi:hypothetical protein